MNQRFPGKKKTLLFSLFLGVFLLFSLSATAHAIPNITRKNLALKMGEQVRLGILDLDTSTPYKALPAKWSIFIPSQRQVAKITSNGTVQGYLPGKTYARAYYDGKSYICNITVNPVDSRSLVTDLKTSTGGDFVYGENTALITFKVEKSCADPAIFIYNSSKKVVYRHKYTNKKPLKPGTLYTVKWDGSCTDGSQAPAGTYHVAIRLGSKYSYSSKTIVLRDTLFSGGDGSSKNPYQVATINDLQNVAFYNGRYFKQTADIGGSLEGSLYTVEKPFVGHYNGNGFSIKNLTIEDPFSTKLALFGGVGSGGSLRNITMEEVTVSAMNEGALLAFSNAGTIAGCKILDDNIVEIGGYNGGLLVADNLPSGHISGCIIDGSSVVLMTGSTYGTYSAASLAVENAGTIMDCTIKGICIIHKNSSKYNPDCLVGMVAANHGTLKNNKATQTSIIISGEDNSRGIILDNTGGMAVSNYFAGKLYYVDPEDSTNYIFKRNILETD